MSGIGSCTSCEGGAQSMALRASARAAETQGASSDAAAPKDKAAAPGGEALRTAATQADPFAPETAAALLQLQEAVAEG